MNAEAKVRASWENASIRFCDPHEGYSKGLWMVSIQPTTFTYESEAAAWTAALAFTEAHAATIAEVDEQIAWLTDGMAVTGDDEPIGKSILSMLQAHRDTLTHGWRGAK